TTSRQALCKSAICAQASRHLAGRGVIRSRIQSSAAPNDKENSMTKATMPEPVAWRTGIDLFRTESAAHLNLRNPDLTPEPLITTAQAEAYANARVREALEQAAGIIK